MMEFGPEAQLRARIRKRIRDYGEACRDQDGSDSADAAVSSILSLLLDTALEEQSDGSALKAFAAQCRNANGGVVVLSNRTAQVCGLVLVTAFMVLPTMAAWRRCRVCGCTQDNACVDDDRGACWWVELDLCSHCQNAAEGT